MNQYVELFALYWVYLIWVVLHVIFQQRFAHYPVLRIFVPGGLWYMYARAVYKTQPWTDLMAGMLFVVLFFYVIGEMIATDRVCLACHKSHGEPNLKTWLAILVKIMVLVAFGAILTLGFAINIGWLK